MTADYEEVLKKAAIVVQQFVTVMMERGRSTSAATAGHIHLDIISIQLLLFIEEQYNDNLRTMFTILNTLFLIVYYKSIVI